MPYRSYPDRMIARFWAKVQKTAGCWLWIGALNSQGYGNLKRGDRWFRAHRYAWELTNGPIPAGMHLCHRCDNPRCVRPDHLFVGSNTDNMRDASRKGRTCRGERRREAKLTAVQVVEIRRLWKTGRLTCDQLAARFGVTRSSAHAAAIGKTWAHIPQESTV